MGVKKHYAKYQKIAEEQGLEKALKELDEDYWVLKRVPRTTYYRIRKRLIGENFEKLFLKFLKFLAESDDLRKSTIAKALGCDVKTVEELRKWIIQNGYSRIVKLILDAKETS